jgi:hypothetical protein
MSRPLAIKYNSQTAAFQGLQEMSDSRMGNTLNSLGLAMANESASDGNLTVNINGTGTVIGAFVDTSRPDIVGSHPVGTTVSSVQYIFNQILDAGSLSPTRPVEWSGDAMRQMSDVSLRTDIYDKMVVALAAKTTGAYVMQPNTPTGGTWVQIASITNAMQSDGTTGGNTTYLWRKINDSAPSTIRPLKLAAELIEMDDDDIATMFDDYANYVIATGKGKYAVSDAAPTGGTWVKMGATLTDTIRRLGDQTYTGSYTRSFTGAYTTYTGFSYTGYYSRGFSDSYTRSNGPYTYNSPVYYSGILRYSPAERYITYTGYYSGTYSRNVPITRTGTTEGYVPTSSTTQVAKSYSGLTVLTTVDNISNTNLWLRTG